MSVYGSLNYFDQEGVVINSGFERYSFLTVADVQAKGNWLKVGINLFGNRSIREGVGSQDAIWRF